MKNPLLTSYPQLGPPLSGSQQHHGKVAERRETTAMCEQALLSQNCICDPFAVDHCIAHSFPLLCYVFAALQRGILDVVATMMNARSFCTAGEVMACEGQSEVGQHERKDDF